MAGKVVWHVTMSLDGFIAGPNDEMSWVFEHHDQPDAGDDGETAQFGAMADEVINTTGAFMSGGRLYRDVDTYPDEIYGGMWKGPVFVLTHRATAAAPKAPGVTFLSGDVRAAVEQGLAAANGKNLVVTGGSVPRQCIEAGLVDEIVVHIVPVLLGEGVRFYDNPGVDRVVLGRTRLAQSGQVTDLRFRVVKE